MQYYVVCKVCLCMGRVIQCYRDLFFEISIARHFKVVCRVDWRWETRGMSAKKGHVSDNLKCVSDKFE